MDLKNFYILKCVINVFLELNTSPIYTINEPVAKQLV